MQQVNSVNRGECAIRSIVAQMEAASTLLKFLADDLEDLGAQTQPEVAAHLAFMAVELQVFATALFERALYVERIGSGDFLGIASNDKGSTIGEARRVG